MKAVFTGGGTAGHVIPAIPVMQALLARDWDICFVGSRTGLEERLITGLDVTYTGISSGKLRRYVSVQNLVDVFRVLAGVCQALWVIRRERPDVVFSKGGFVSFPVVFAAWLWRVPVVAHESDLTPGLANRLAMPFVHTLCVNFPETRPSKFSGELACTGTPVRRELLEGDALRGRNFLGVSAGDRVLVVTGGSLGADHINLIVREALDELLERVVVVHLCGRGKMAEISRAGYLQYEYLDEHWGDVLACADGVVSRAGANTLYELLCLGKRHLLIPLSRSVSRGDQIENADYARARGYSRVIEEEALTASRLIEGVDEILAQAETGADAITGFQAPDSVNIICDCITRAAQSR